MKAVRNVLWLGALAVAITSILGLAMPDRLTGGFVVRAQNCVMSGQATVVNGTFTCDCTVIGARECGCIVKCPPGGLGE